MRFRQLFKLVLSASQLEKINTPPKIGSIIYLVTNWTFDKPGDMYIKFNKILNNKKLNSPINEWMKKGYLVSDTKRSSPIYVHTDATLKSTIEFATATLIMKKRVDKNDHFRHTEIYESSLFEYGNDLSAFYIEDIMFYVTSNGRHVIKTNIKNRYNHNLPQLPGIQELERATDNYFENTDEDV